MGDDSEHLSDLQRERPRGSGEAGEMKRGSRTRIEITSSTDNAVYGYWVANYRCWWNSALSLQLLHALL